MYKQIHQPKQKIEITLPKVLTIVASLFLFLVIPIQVTTLLKEESKKEDNTMIIQNTVAENQDENNESNVLGVSIEKESESDIYVAVGSALIFVALLLMFFLYREIQSSKKSSNYLDLDNSWYI